MPCPRLYPPNRTPLWESMAVNEKSEHGGGRLPVVGGEDHTPAVGDHTQCCTHSKNHNVHAQRTSWGCGIADVHVLIFSLATCTHLSGVIVINK